MILLLAERHNIRTCRIFAKYLTTLSKVTTEKLSTSRNSDPGGTLYTKAICKSPEYLGVL
jgi:hypothetical protein